MLVSDGFAPLKGVLRTSLVKFIYFKSHFYNRGCQSAVQSIIKNDKKNRLDTNHNLNTKKHNL